MTRQVTAVRLAFSTLANSQVNCSLSLSLGTSASPSDKTGCLSLSLNDTRFQQASEWEHLHHLSSHLISPLHFIFTSWPMAFNWTELSSVQAMDQLVCSYDTHYIHSYPSFTLHRSKRFHRYSSSSSVRSASPISDSSYYEYSEQSTRKMRWFISLGLLIPAIAAVTGNVGSSLIEWCSVTVILTTLTLLSE